VPQLGGDPIGILARFLASGVPGPSYGIVSMILGLIIFVELQLVTDGRTDKRTHDDSIYHATIAPCVKNGVQRTIYFWHHSQNLHDRTL